MQKARFLLDKLTILGKKICLNHCLLPKKVI